MIGNLIVHAVLSIASHVFEIIADAYSLFYGLATTRLFTSETIQTISNNIYIMVSVVILFAFSVKLIEAIVNPDMLTDSKKGVTGVLKRTIIGLILIVAIPNIFNFLYYFQAEIISSSLVEKIVLGYSDAESDATTDYNGGVLTSTIITGFVYPVDENGVRITERTLCGEDTNCNFADKLVELNPEYENYVSFLGGNPQYDKLESLTKDLAGFDGTLYKAEAGGFLLLGIGLFILYQVIVLCFDAALRLVNLGILEMIAPIIIVAYIAGGSDYLSKWFKMVIEKFTGILVRIAALAFMTLGLTLINDSNSIFNNDSASFLFKAFVVIGLLRLIKDLPNLISKLFGVDVKTGSGIKGRLGEMAGIGGLAQKAWAGMGGLAKTAGITAVAGLGAAGKGIQKIDKKLSAKAAQTGWGKKFGITDKTVSEMIGATKFGRGAKKVANYGGRVGRIAAAGYKSGGKDTTKAVKDAFNKEFSDVVYRQKEAAKKEKDIKLSAPIAAAAKGSVILNGQGQIDLAGTIKGMKKGSNYENGVGTNSYDVGRDIINGSHLSGKSKEILQKQLKADYIQQREQFQLHGRQEMLNFVQSLEDNAKTASEKALVTDLKDRINTGKINSLDQINDVIDKMDFSDRSGASNLMESLIKASPENRLWNNMMASDSLSESAKTDIRQLKEMYDAGELSKKDYVDGLKTFGVPDEYANKLATDLNEALVRIKSQWDSGNLTSDELEQKLIDAGVSVETATEISKNASDSSSDAAEIYKRQAAELANKEGAIGEVSSAEMNARIQKANEDAEKAANSMKELLESATIEKDEINKIKSHNSKMVKAEYSDRTTNADSWGDNSTIDLNDKDKEKDRENSNKRRGA